MPGTVVRAGVTESDIGYDLLETRTALSLQDIRAGIVIYISCVREYRVERKFKDV